MKFISLFRLYRRTYRTRVTRAIADGTRDPTEEAPGALTEGTETEPVGAPVLNCAGGGLDGALEAVGAAEIEEGEDEPDGVLEPEAFGAEPDPEEGAPPVANGAPTVPLNPFVMIHPGLE